MKPRRPARTPGHMFTVTAALLASVLTNGCEPAEEAPVPTAVPAVAPAPIFPADLDPLDPAHRDRLVELLEDRYRAIGQLSLEYQAEGIVSDRAATLASVRIHVDGAAASCLVDLEMVWQERRVHQHFLTRGLGAEMLVWGDEAPATLIVIGPVFEEVVRTAQRARRALNHAVAGGSSEGCTAHEACRRAIGGALTIKLVPKRAPDLVGSFGVFFGASESPASWLMMIESSGMKAARGDAPEELAFESEEGDVHLVVDARTGILRIIRVRDYDGTTRQLRLVPREPEAGPSPTELPETFTTSILSAEEFGMRLNATASALASAVAYTAAGWRHVGAAGREEQVIEEFARWAAGARQAWVELYLRLAAEKLIASALESGRSEDDLLASAAELRSDFEAYLEARSDGRRAFVDRGMSEFEAAVRSAMTDGQMLGESEQEVRTAIEIMRGAFDPAAVERHRQAAHPLEPAIERIFAEAIGRLGRM